MPIAALGIVNAITAIAAWLSTYVTKKVAIGGALLLVSLALGGVLWLALRALAVGGSYVLPSVPGADLALYAMNSTAVGVFISTAGGVEIAVSAYMWHKRMAAQLAAAS